MREGGHKVVVADAAPSPARKFLLAGRGGLNLTHSEPLDAFLARYGARARAARAGDRRLPARGAARLERGARRADLRRLERAGVSRKASRRRRCCAPGCAGSTSSASSLRPRRRLIGLAPSGARCSRRREGERGDRAPAIVLALGGASWPRLGGDGGWVEVAARGGRRGRAAEARQLPAFWSTGPSAFRERFAGAPLKAIALDASARRASRGEAMVTADGLEGGAIYALSANAARGDRGRGRRDAVARPQARRLRRGAGAQARRARRGNRSRPSCARRRACRRSRSR